MKTPVLALLCAVLILTGCSKYGNVTIQYPSAPAAVLPNTIRTLAMVNRALIKEKERAVVEAVISGEIAGSDQLASDEALKGVFDRINGWNDLNVVIPSTTELYGTGTRQTPELLDWGLVKQICDSSRADALLVLETFDSNSDLLANVVNGGLNTLINGTAPSTVNQVRMTVYCYWRLYDPKERRIIDQYQSTSFMTFDAGGGVLPVAPPDALPGTAYFAGGEYIERFLPTWYDVSRTLYQRGTGKEKQRFLSAFRRAEVADWEGAISLWKILAESPNRKNAGRACLNIAVGYEVLGNINEALIWSRKAYTDYGDKLARDYQNDLSYRQRLGY